MKIGNPAKLVVSILVCQIAGGVGGLFTAPAIPEWYASLAKPSFNPPNWVFGPVWTVLYLLMALSLYLVWKQAPGHPQAGRAVALFFVQLALNVVWSLLFFGLRSPGAAFAEVLVLLAAITAAAVASRPVSRAASYLYAPYFVWVAFAAALNFFLWRLNT